jgi:hypothetical protein
VNNQQSFGRKTLTFTKGEAALEKVTVVEKPLPSETEATFTQRLLTKYQSKQGMMEIVFKDGRPDYAIITLGNLVSLVVMAFFHLYNAMIASA